MIAIGQRTGSIRLPSGAAVQSLSARIRDFSPQWGVEAIPCPEHRGTERSRERISRRIRTWVRYCGAWFTHRAHTICTVPMGASPWAVAAHGAADHFAAVEFRAFATPR